ncbi:hypothetical protein [Verrucomicrobium spinosum]|uniref:hypothetical protein n=1 Tax=Verrucomicrobium spinosum TaxID=2736 RepID=UPI0001746B92|nr:hypothetical protein [Verrucomicrobium spinosum]
MITSDQLDAFRAGLRRCEGYTTLNMLKEAERELLQLPAELRLTLPYLMVSMNFFIHCRQWDMATRIGACILESWPDCEDVRRLAMQCYVRNGCRGELPPALLQAPGTLRQVIRPGRNFGRN